LIVSFSALTVNADEHPVMRQFHKAGGEKRTPVIIQPEHYNSWLRAYIPSAEEIDDDLDKHAFSKGYSAAWGALRESI
jgi:hypothetical protein